MTVWVTRDKTAMGSVTVWGRKPFDQMDDDGFWNDTIAPIWEYDLARDFRRWFKWTPAKGTCNECDMTVSLR